MAACESPKLSLVAQYDDLCRYRKVLTTGLEKEFKNFAENQLVRWRKQKKKDGEVKALRDTIEKLKFKNKSLVAKINSLKNLIQDAQSAKRKIECERICLERTIGAVRDIILSGESLDNDTKQKLAFLAPSYKPNFNSPVHLETIEESESLPSLSDIDESEDDLENCRSPSYRSSRSNEIRSISEILLKKKKLNESEEFFDKINEAADQQRVSEVTSLDAGIVSRQINKQDSALLRCNVYNQRHDTDSPARSTPVSRQSLLSETSRPLEDQDFPLRRFSKKHQFVSKTVLKPTQCMKCKQTINCLRKSVRCESCGVTLHPDCKNIDCFCFPITNAPTDGKAGTVTDYTSSSYPMIPPLIVHCVREIESRGMEEIGLYRIPSSERDVKDVIDKFVSERVIPYLADVNTHTLCIAVKEFLRSLAEPLVTHKLWRGFIDAANIRNEVESSYALLGLVHDLPESNRNTLSFLILHWQKVAESPRCKMDIEILSKILGPIVVGYSVAAQSKESTQEEGTYQYQVMKRLLSISSACWQSMAGVVMCESLEEIPVINTPPKGRFLSPVHAFTSESRSSISPMTRFTPKS